MSELSEAELRARLAQAGIVLWEEEVAQVLATARFLARAAERVRAAAP